MTDGEFADELNAEVVAFYAEAQERFATAEDATAANRELKNMLVDYLDMRLRSVSLFESALRERNAGRVSEAMALQREADALATRIIESNAAEGTP